MKKIALFLLLQIIVFNGFASHIGGGQIWTEYNGVNQTVHLSLVYTCDPGSATIQTNATLRFRSLKLGISVQRAFTNPVIDTLGFDCNGSNSCSIRQNQQTPGYILVEYTDTISLSPSDDWEITYQTGAITRVNNFLSGTMAIGTNLDNTQNNGSGVHVSAPGSIFLTVSDTMRVPMQILGAYGADSFTAGVAEPYQDYYNKTTMRYNSGMGYSASNPFGSGSSVYYDSRTNELVVYLTNIAKYYFALDIKAYKQGQVYSTTHIQSNMYVFPSAPPDTSRPVLKKNTNMDFIACENQSGIKNIEFIDNHSNDSIYVDVDYPNVNPVFNVSHFVSSAPANAKVALSWSTSTAIIKPQNPYEVRLRYGSIKNGCKVPKGTYVTTIRLDDSCKKDVWPGDANNDKIANLWDILAIGVNYNDVGYARQSTSNSWQAYYCPAWNDTWSNNNINTKYADCNGDGIVNLNDISAVSLNFGKTHPKGTVPKPTAGPDLKFEPTGIEFPIGAKVRVPIVLGNANEVLNGELYGWSGNITLVGLDNTAIGVYPRDGFLAHGGTNVTYKHSYGGNNIGWAHTRTDRQGIAGANGVLCMVEFYVPANTPMGTRIDLQLSDVNLIDKDGNLITEYDVIDTFAYVSWPSDVATIDDGAFAATVVPNPTHGKAYLHVDAQKAGNLNIQITNIMGAVVHRNIVQTVAGNNIFALPTDELAPAMYIIHLQDEAGNTHALKAIVR